MVLRQRVSSVALCVVFAVFLLKDVSLFRTIQTIQFDRNTSSPSPQISCKTVMLDHVNSYVMSPLSHAFERSTRLTARFPRLTANHISYSGVVVALLAARVVLSDQLWWRRLAVGLFLVRQFVDDLDGLVARIHAGLDRNVDVSVTGTQGYAVDGVCDAIGFAAFVGAAFVQSLRSQHSLLKYKALDESDARAPRLLLRNYALFGAQMALSCVLWNRYIDAFHRLLEVQATPSTVQIFKSRLQWVVMWLWRCYGNAHQLMTFFLMAVWLGRTRELVQWAHLVGFVAIVGLAFLTEMHINDIETYLKQ